MDEVLSRKNVSLFVPHIVRSVPFLTAGYLRWRLRYHLEKPGAFVKVFCGRTQVKDFFLQGVKLCATCTSKVNEESTAARHYLPSNRNRPVLGPWRSGPVVGRLRFSKNAVNAKDKF